MSCGNIFLWSFFLNITFGLYRTRCPPTQILELQGNKRTSTFPMQKSLSGVIVQQQNMFVKDFSHMSRFSLSHDHVFQVQIRNDLRLDTFAELPVSLVLFSLICIDIVERIRHCRLTGQGTTNTITN